MLKSREMRFERDLVSYQLLSDFSDMSSTRQIESYRNDEVVLKRKKKGVQIKYA